MAALYKNTLNFKKIFGLASQNGTAIIETPRFQRRKYSNNSQEITLDSFPKANARCCFIRSAKEAAKISLQLAGNYKLKECVSGGQLLVPAQKNLPFYWLPRQPVLRQLDRQEHITEEEPLSLNLQNNSNGLLLDAHVPKDWRLDIPIWQFKGQSKKIAIELRSLSEKEAQALFLSGTHSTYKKPSDFYLHLINGFIYENRRSWPYRYKICSEDDAYSLYLAFKALGKATKKQVYSLLKEQLLLSLLARQQSDGSWRHGEWSHGMESHFRMHVSGMNILLEELSEKQDVFLLERLKKAAAFIAAKKDSTSLGTWYLHDELEQSIETLKRSPGKFKPGTAFGKSPSNMLILNTHLHTLLALDSYQKISKDFSYKQDIESAKQAALKILQLKPAGLLYKLLFKLIESSIAVGKENAFDYLLLQAQYFFPRLAMPNGFIARHVGLKGLSLSYHCINLLDIARFAHRFPEHRQELEPVIKNGLDFVQKPHIYNYLKNNKRTKHSLAFLAQALYFLCLAYNNPNHKKFLGKVLVDLKEKKVGIPPLLLEASSESKMRRKQWMAI